MPPALFRFPGLAASTGGGATFDDAAASNRVLAIVVTLIVVGLVVIGVTVWFWRTTRPEPEALGPLAVLGSRKYRRSSEEGRRRALAAARATAGDGEPERLPVPELADLAKLASRELPSLDDLADPPPAVNGDAPDGADAEAVQASSPGEDGEDDESEPSPSAR